MKIKDRLSLYFTLTSAATLVIVLVAVYLTLSKFLEADFYERLSDRTMVTAKLYLEADEISRDSLDIVRSTYFEKLNNEVVRIYNADNSPEFIGEDQQYWSSEVINKVRKQGKIQFKEDERQVVGIFYKDNQGDFVILVSAIDRSSDYRMNKLLNTMIIIFIITFFGLLLFGRWIAERILSPLAVFVTDVKQIRSSNLHHRVKEGHNKDEINLLAQNFNNLMEHLENAFVLQKTFVANASHELRTPITRMVIAAEVALSKERDAFSYKNALLSVLEDAEKMEKIITGLLDLAQTDLEFGSSQIVPLRIDELIWVLQEEWANKPEKFELLVSMDNLPEEESELLIQANPIQLHIALDNIISNAFKFSDHQPVQCVLEVRTHDLQLSFIDKGVGIPIAKQVEIFKPFYSISTESRHKGNGMGLYMAHKIITLFKGKIQVISEEGKGSTFILTFPKF